MYTVIDFRPTSEPLVAIYSHRDGSYSAAPIEGIATYRDLNDKGSENYLVPVSAFSLTSEQQHFFMSATSLVSGLPKWVVRDSELHNEAVLWSNVDDADDLPVYLDVDSRRWVPVDGWTWKKGMAWAAQAATDWANNSKPGASN